MKPKLWNPWFIALEHGSWFHTFYEEQQKEEREIFTKQLLSLAEEERLAISWEIIVIDGEQPRQGERWIVFEG